MKKGKSKDEKSKKSKDSKVKKEDENKSEKSAASKSKSKGKDKDKASSKGKEKEGSKTPTKKETKSKKPLDGQSQISSISQIPVAPADCIHHKSPFINFCETCEELVCNQCTVFGPHNNHLHRILKMTDAYRLRKFYLVEAIRSNLVDKRDKIIAQLHRLEYRIEEIKFVKNIIERDIRSEYSGILERLKNHEGVKLAILTHEVSLVQRELDTINDLGNKFFELTSMECEKVEQERKISRFLIKSKEMYESIEYIVSRPDRLAPDLALNEIPREVEGNRDLVKKALAAREINSFKNQILWKLITDSKAEENIIKKEVEERASAIIKDLSEEVESLNEKLKQHKLICFYCGLKMSSQNVNLSCELNKNAQTKVQRRFQTQKFPSEKQIGNQRHFFTKLLSV